MRVPGSLTGRIFLASASLAVVSIAVAVYVVNRAVTDQAQAELGHGLADAATLVDEYRALLFEHFSVQARLIADLPLLKATVELDHPPTVKPLAAEYADQVGADVFLVTNRTGHTLALIGASAPEEIEPSARPAVESALAGRESSAFWPGTRGMLQVATVPIWIDRRQPEILGTLSAGFHLDERFATEMKNLTDSEIAFVVDGRIQATTLRGLTPAIVREVATAGQARQVVIAGEEYLGLVRPLAPIRRSARRTGRSEASPPPSAVGRGSASPMALVLRSRSERLRFLAPLRTALATTGVVAVLLATVLAYLVARTITRPLGAITRTMREMAATGDPTRAAPMETPATWDDEDARLLATTFNSLLQSIARYQREVAHRERLSSLGRLATTMAHEIRNPLMIIKATIRTLRREDARPERIRQAAEDIDGEVQRLNRLVNDVLDFARPILFEHATVDLGALCRDAAGAVSAGREGPAIAVLIAPGAADVVTDRERLRQALVNVLENARHAVEAWADQPAMAVRAEGGRAAGNPGRAADIEVQVGPVDPEDRVRIVIRDTGIGIAPDDVPRLFEPFFTTRRGGSGLGLAVVKNIVEGLGGTVRVTSEQGRGTEVAIELPRRPV